MWWAKEGFLMNIKTVAVLPLAVIFGIIAAIVLAIAMQAPAHAHDGEDHSNKQAAKKEAAYTYTVQQDDSYSKLARKAIQTYGLKNKVDLSKSRIVYAETKLTQEAGSPGVTTGEKVEIKESTVKSWVEKAKALKNDQAAKWDAYTQNVNFNTNNVGEARS